MSAHAAAPAFRRAAVLSLAGLLAAPLAAPAAALQAQGAPERRTLKGDRVAIFDLVGSIRVEAGTGSDVEVEVTRQGADAGRLTIETGERRGRETLRVVFPGDRFAFPKMGRGSSTSTRVEDDGTFYNSRSGRQVRIAGHRVFFRRAHDINDVGRPQILFLAPSVEDDVERVVARLTGTPVLIVADSDGFGRSDGTAGAVR